MLISTVSLAFSLMLAQPPPVNIACAVLTPAHVTSLIGAAKVLPMGAAPNGSNCMFQNQNKIITVLVATNTAGDAAQRLFDAKKRIAAGTDIAGGGVPASGAAVKNVAIFNQRTFVEVRVSDSRQKSETMAQVLRPR